MTDSNAIVNTMWDVSFSNLDKYEPLESGRWYVVIFGEKFMHLQQIVYLSCRYMSMNVETGYMILTIL